MSQCQYGLLYKYTRDYKIGRKKGWAWYLVVSSDRPSMLKRFNIAPQPNLHLKTQTMSLLSAKHESLIVDSELHAVNINFDITKYTSSILSYRTISLARRFPTIKKGTIHLLYTAYLTPLAALQQ